MPARHLRIAPIAFVFVMVAAAASASPAPIRGADGGSTVLGWGANFFGEVGDGTTTQRTAPVGLPGLDDIVDLAAGSSHSLALRSDGSVLAWGSNLRGQLGIPDLLGQTATTPTLVPGLTDVVAIEAAYHTSLALDAEGNIWEWGQPIDAGGTPAAVTVVAPTQVADLLGTSIAAGGGHRLAASQGTARGWGTNTRGQLGDGATSSTYRTFPGAFVDRAVSVAAGFDHSLALRDDGTVWSSGWNIEGELGDGTRTDRLTPVQVAGLTDVVAIDAADLDSMALRADGTLWAWGDSMGGLFGWNVPDALTPKPINGLSGVTQFDIGSVQTVAAITADGVWTWGAHTGDPSRDWWPYYPILLPGTAGATDAARGIHHGLILLNGLPRPPVPTLPLLVETTLAVDAPATAPLDEPVTITATVSPVPPLARVVVTEGGATRGIGEVDPSTGEAEVSITLPTEGDHDLVATLDAPGYVASSASFAMYAGRTRTTIEILGVEPAEPEAGDYVTLTAQIDPISDDLERHLAFYVDGVGTEISFLGPTTPIPVGPLSAGDHEIVIRFEGDDVYAPSESAPYLLHVGGVPTSISLSVMPSGGSIVGMPVTITPDVQPSDAVGTITIFDGDSVLGGTAPGGSFTTTDLEAGTHVLSARFEPGTAEFEPSQSEPIEYVVALDAVPPTGTVTIDDVDGYSGSPLVPLRFNAMDEGSGVAWVEVSRDGDAWERLAWPVEEPWLWMVTPDGPDGLYLVLARFVDAAGNTSLVAKDVTYLDRTAPTLTGRPTAAVDATLQVGLDGLIPIRLSWPAATDAGSGVRWYRIERSLDNGPWVDWAQIDADPSAKVAWFDDTAPPASVRYRVTALDALGWTSLSITSVRLELEMYQESSAEVATTGRWEWVPGDAVGSQLGVTYDAGATMRLRFSGRGIYWVTRFGGWNGEVDVYIDGKRVSRIDLGAGDAPRRIAFSYRFQQSGDHQIKIRCVGTAARPSVESDAFIVADW